MNLIANLHDYFLDEAKKSPMLLSDLANLEKYISESYSERSLIELIQNADDANANKFYITTLSKNTILVANNGDYFTEEDVKSLCRSGSSTKKRKSNTIGYRGIGFKSVVNYTNNVHLVSGNIKLTFSKEMTKNDLPNIDNVPLIRIPHEFKGDKFEKYINETISQGYTTIFIFETKIDSLIEEIKNFDETSLLFLRNLEFFKSKTNEFKEIHSKRTITEYGELILLTNNNTEKWLIITENISEEKINIAFLLNNENKAVKLDKTRSVIHSFMPTNNPFIIPCKINGDFSTDPSRTKIVIDDESTNTIYEISKLFSKIIINCLNNKNDDLRLISTISALNIEKYGIKNSKSINDLFIDELIKQLKSSLNGKKLLIQPDWLSESSFLELYKNSTDNLLITNSLNNKIYGIKELLLKLGFEEAQFNNAIDKASKNKYSEDTRVDLTVKAIEKTRFSTFKKDKDKINEAFLINTDKSIEKTKNTKEKASNNFISKVKNKIDDKNDLDAFAKKFNINYDGLKQEKEVDEENIIDEPKIVKFGKKASLTKWRSVEKNVTEIIKNWDTIKEAEDVSLMNLGYDTKAITNDGTELFFEIKSVNKLGDPLRLTNNEYSQAHLNKNKYYLVIASQQEDYIEVCFVKNPIKNLELTKRVVKWEWICDEYTGEYSKNYF